MFDLRKTLSLLFLRKNLSEVLRKISLQLNLSLIEIRFFLKKVALAVYIGIGLTHTHEMFFVTYSGSMFSVDKENWLHF